MLYESFLSLPNCFLGFCHVQILNYNVLLDYHVWCPEFYKPFPREFFTCNA